MGEHLLSLLHIQKLGHPIEEIRSRALASVISKYNLNLVDESNLENTKLLLENLLNWFKFEKFSDTGRVLELLLKILKYKNADLILKEIDRKNFLKQVREIEIKVGCEYAKLIQDIIGHIRKIEDDLGENHLGHLHFPFSELLNGNVSNDTYESHKSYYNLTSLGGTKCRDVNSDFKKNEVQDGGKKQEIFKVEFFPWQHLTSGDKHVLTSVYDGLRYIDNKNLILQSCQFFNEVSLRDFPTEVFIQRPIILKTFLQLIECTEQDVRIPVIKCLTKTVQHLRDRMRATLNSSLFNLKKEFYTTSVFPSTPDDSYEHLTENFTQNMVSLDEDFQFDGNDSTDYELRKYQLSVPQFCFEILLQTLPHLGDRCNQEETNCILYLSYEILQCLTYNLKSSIWDDKELISKFYKIFGILYELLKFSKGKNKITYIFLIYFTVELLNCLKPPSGIELSEVLVGGLQSELGSCTNDYVLVLLFPSLHIQIVKYVEKLVGPKEKEAMQDHRDVLLILDSMKSSIRFLKSFGDLKSRMEKLECMNAGLASLDFHQNFNVIQLFTSSCLLKWRKSHLKEPELKLREKILIKLLAHCNEFVKISIYKEISKYASSLLGEEEAKSPRFDFPGDKMDFLFRTDVLTEIVCHGLTSSLAQVRKFSNDILSRLLKSKFIMSDICWNDFLGALIPCLGLLQCYADKSTTLGRCVVKMFDPDVAKSTGLPPIEILKGNIRFLFSKNNLIRDEAISRLFWLLSKEDCENKKLPRISLLTGLNLSGICSCVTPQEYRKIGGTFYSPGRLCDVLEILSADKVEPNFRRSALSQMGVMMDDFHLHSTFLEQKGLEIVLRILDNCLIEREYRNYPDSVKPIVDILRALAFQNATIRQELSSNIKVMYNILRGLFLFSSDDTFRQNAVELLCLLLYNDCILRVPPDVSHENIVSLPELVVTQMCLPFLTHIHWRNSKHFEPSFKMSTFTGECRLYLLKPMSGLHHSVTVNKHQLGSERNEIFHLWSTFLASFIDIHRSKWTFEQRPISVFHESILNKENCSKLIRTYWAIEWVGSLNDVLALQAADLQEKAHSPGIGDDMKISADVLESLRSCSFHMSVKQTLYNIQNATTHEAVFSAVNKLHSFFLLFNISKSNKADRNADIGSDTVLCHMLWESTLERFMTAQPSCNLDEALLLEVIRLVQLLIRTIKSERLIDWVGKLLIDEHHPLIKLFQKIGSEDSGLVGKELRLAVIELTQQIVTLRTSLDQNKWFIYLELISNHLRFDKKSEFYNVAYVDWLLSLLVDLTGNWIWNFTEKAEFLEKLIIRIMEIIIAFHCTKDSAISFMGINILKNSLLVLNQIMESSQKSLKEWQKLWFRALTKVIGHEGDFNYCWLLSLWFTRDPITRAAAFELLVGFSTTSLSCDLLMDQLQLRFDHIWAQAFKALLDENECSFVREKAALLLSNLTSYGTKGSYGNFLEHLQKIYFYERINKIITNYDCQSRLSMVRLHNTDNRFSGHVATTPSFLNSVCVLLTSIMALNPGSVSELCFEFGIFKNLISALGDIPESAKVCENHEDAMDILKMYIAICRLLKLSIFYDCTVYSFVLQSQRCINYFFSMINYNLYCEDYRTIRTLKCELWAEIFDFFSALLADNPECTSDLANQSTGFLLINRSMTENGIDPFISSLYIAMTSDYLDLRTLVLKFFVNLFRHEMQTPKHITVTDIFERKVSGSALKIAAKYGWKAFKISEDLTSNFGIRSADILLQTYSLGSNCCVQTCRTIIADCLASLLAVCGAAQNFCIGQGLSDTLITALKQICVQLNLENVENLKKSSSRKKIDGILSDAESLFRLLTNLMLGNAKAKSVVADCALSVIALKLWPWSVAKRGLFVVNLKMLCTFTHSCDQACRTLVLSGSLSMLGLKKSPGSLTLMAAVMNQVPIEMSSISTSHDSEVLNLCLQLLTNCCRVTECRSVIAKGNNFLQCFVKLHPNRKKRSYDDAVIDSWLKFFIAFSSHQEGQLTLTKNRDLLDLFILKSKSTKSSHRLHALSVLRNVCFHQLNRVRLLSCCSLLSLMFDALDSEKPEEVQCVAVMIWALTCNSQKAKVIVRSSGFEAKLASAKRRCVITEDTDTADLIEVVLGILKNK